MFPDEFDLFKQSHRAKIAMQKNDLGSTDGDSVIEQFIHEIPETLYTMIKMKLSDEEYREYTSQEGTKWFGKKFKAFAVAEKI